MIESARAVITRIAFCIGKDGDSLHSMMLDAASKATDGRRDFGGIIAATFSNPNRFPSLAIHIAGELGLPNDIPAFDLQLACSAYPYAVHLASDLSVKTGKPVLVLDGDAQSPFVDATDHATGSIFSNAATASIVTADQMERSRFAFLSRHDDALSCSATGPIRMDGFKVFTFVATEVSAMLREFGTDFDYFAPHQANPYMVRQLAKSLGLGEKLLTIDDALRNPGSCSVAMALAAAKSNGSALIAGFGAGYSAAAGIVTLRLD